MNKTTGAFRGEGLKYDGEKPRLDLIPPDAIEEIGAVLTIGAKKYGDNNWQMLDNFNERYYAAALRHLMSWKKGESCDEETGLSHISHALTNLCFLIRGEINLNK